MHGQSEGRDFSKQAGKRGEVPCMNLPSVEGGRVSSICCARRPLSTLPWAKAPRSLEPKLQKKTQHISTGKQFKRYKSHSLDGDIHGKEEDVEVGCMGLNTPNPTPPSTFTFPKEIKETTHSASEGIQGQNSKI